MSAPRKTPPLAIVAGTDGPAEGPHSNASKIAAVAAKKQDIPKGKARRKERSRARPAADAPEGSEIIAQCVIYVQCLAAYDAGFDVDHTGDSDYASKGGHIKKARRAMFKLISLSPHAKPGAKPLTALELHAKAGVLAAMYGLREGEAPDEIEQAYIRFFAGEVSDYLAASHTVHS